MAEYLPTSDDAIAMAKLRRMVALSPAFQLKLGSGDQYAAALARVMYEGVPGDDLAAAENVPSIGTDRPWASVWLISTGFVFQGEGFGDSFTSLGTLHLYLATPRNPAMNSWNDRRLEAIDFLSKWTADIVALSSEQDSSPVIAGECHLTLQGIDAPSHDHVPQQLQNSAGDFYFRHLAIKYGPAIGGM